MHRDIQRYLVVGPARSGTTVVHLALLGHPQVSALSDEVRAERLFGDGVQAFTFGNEREEERRKAFPALFDALARLNASSETRAAGLKCAVSSVETARCLVDRVKETFPDLRIILVIREDLLAQFGSLLRAKQTGRWHSWRGEAAPAAKLRIDKAAYSHYYLNHRAIRAVLRGLAGSRPCIEISYENDICGGTDYVGRLYDFLGLDHVAPDWLRSEKVAAPARDYIVDYDALKALEPVFAERGHPLRPSLRRAVLKRLARLGFVRR